MKKSKGRLKAFFGEFKQFITRGNVLDMAVGVIVGGAFTGIVNGLSNFILKPLINALLAVVLGDGALEGAITILGKPAYTAEGAIDLANTIYIDWGSFVSSIINFLIVAFVLFLIVKTMNNFVKAREQLIAGLELDEKKEVAKIRREQKVSKKVAKAIYEEKLEAAKAAKAAEETAAKEAAAAEAARLAAEAEAKAMANTKLLEEIRDLLKNK